MVPVAFTWYSIGAFLSLPRRLNEHGEVFLYLFLSDVLGQRFGTKGIFDLRVLRNIFRGNHSIFQIVFTSPVVGVFEFCMQASAAPFHSFEPISRKDSRISSSVGSELSNFATTDAASLGV